MRFFTLSTALAFILSFLAKLSADAWLHERWSIVGSFIGLQPAQNPGVAFGIRLPDGIQTLVIVCALVFVVFLAWKQHERPADAVGYGMIVGGALGNVVDRIFDGHVTDFLQVGTFPIFNIADSCITIGVLLLLWEGWVHHARDLR